MNTVNLISLFPEDHINVTFEPDRQYSLPPFLPERMIFTENWQVPDLEFNDPQSLIIRNSRGYIQGTSEEDFLLQNKLIIEKNIIFDKKGVYSLIDNFTSTPIYQELLNMYNKMNSDNFFLKIENSNGQIVTNLYCDDIFIIRLNNSNFLLNYYVEKYYLDPLNNNFKVYIDFSPRIRNFYIFITPTGFKRDNLLLFSLFLFYDNIYISHNENIAKITLEDMDLFVRNYYLSFINNLMIELPENDFIITSQSYYQDNLVRFYNILDIINNRAL